VPRAEFDPGLGATVDAVDDRVAELRRWCDDPSGILALNTGTAAYRTASLPGFIAYRRSGGWLIQLGGVHAPADARGPLLRAFRAHARALGCRVLAVQVQRHDAEELAAEGFTVNQLGASYAMPVESFTLTGRRYVRLRNKISRARRAGVAVELTTVDRLPPADRNGLAQLDREWLRAKGRFTRPMRFMVGELDGPAARLRRLAVARQEGRLVGYVSLSPVFGSRPGWLHDLSRRASDATPGTMELLVTQCLSACVEQGAAWWHFGFTPFTGLDSGWALGRPSPSVDRLVRFLAAHGETVYPAASQLDYKQKWGHLQTLPDYLGFDGRPRLSGVLGLLRATNLI